MTYDQTVLFALIILIFSFLIWGRIRFDLVAFAALVIAFIMGVVPRENVFSGFGHPAVVIVALVLVVSRGLSRSGAIEILARKLLDSGRSLMAHIGIMASISALLSSFMNNVAALALLMSMDVQTAHKAKRSPALTLMPLSFASILGGMVTLIGTPPNIVIATFRETALGEPYSMFDFTPVGAAVAVAGVIFVVFLGWRLIPIERSKHNTPAELEDLKGYIAEARVPETSKAIDVTLRELEPLAEKNDVLLLGLVRRGKRLPGSVRNEVVRKNDLIVMKGSPEAIDLFVGEAGLKYGGTDKQEITGAAISLVEVVVAESSRINGRTAIEMRLLYRQGVKLLGISRRGQHIRERVEKARIHAGDILLLLGPEDQLSDVVDWLGCLPLAERGLEILQRNKAWLASGLFTAGIVMASLGYIPLALALAVVVVAYIALDIVPISQVYDAIEWPVIVLLACMIPIGAALESSGGTALVATTVIGWLDQFPTVMVLVVLMIITMTLSDVLNNVATALIAAPIAVDMAQRLDANPDAFLMAVAVASSCAFLTPIGHQNNTIIMGPGGYKFSDYWRMGLPLEILVVVVSIPMILIVWPL